ncbi:MAG: hypothetical protein U9R16_03420 [Campylobacterota bacterium]|nr:hypothetical protein [Campylobacterota bacterium]
MLNRNWRKHKPNLYKTVMKGLAFDDLLKKSEENLEELKEFSCGLIENKK